MVQCSTAGGDCNIVLNEETDTISCTTHSNTDLVGKLYASSIENTFNTNIPNTTYNADSGLREPAVLSASSSETGGVSYDGYIEYLNIINRILGTEYSDSDSFLEDMKKDFYNIAKSVAKYHGFYISRYEMSKSGNSNVATSVANVIPLTKSSDNMLWYGLYAYGKTYNTSNVGNSMIWGSQYDAMMRWMQKNGINVTSDIGDDRNTEMTTGTKETDKIKNVYDLYGSHPEITLEACNNGTRIWRGRLL